MRKTMRAFARAVLRLVWPWRENRLLKADLSISKANLEDAQLKLAANERRRTESEIKSRYRAREQLILVPRLMDLLPDNDRLVIADGGAREVDRDSRWRPFPPKRLKFIGFEPDQTEAERLNKTPGPGGLEWIFVPAGLWSSTGERAFEHNRAPGGSSFLPQN